MVLRCVDFKYVVPLIFSLFLVLTPWEALRGVLFEDLQNYLARIELIKEHGAAYIFLSKGGLSSLSSEVGWGYILFLISNVGFSPELGLKIISFISAFVISKFIVQRASLLVGIVLLFNPLVIDFVLSQHRNALAFSMFLFAVNFKSLRVYFIVMLFACSIHIASLLVFTVYYISVRLHQLDESKYTLNLKKMCAILCGLSFGILMVFGRGIFLEAIGDRRADYNAVSVSILYSSFWYGCLVLLTFFYKKSDEYYFLALFYLCIFSVASLLGDYSSRYLVLSLPFIITSLCRMDQKISHIWLVLFIFQTVVQWVYWFQLQV